MARLFKSSKFQAVIADAAFSTLIIVLAWFLAPDKMEQALMLIGIWQPVVLAYIAGTAYEDGQQKRAAEFAYTVETDDSSNLGA
jgi:hypothetical protein